MGTYVNPGNTAFREAVNSKIYIDKTELIAYTNSEFGFEYKRKICMCQQAPPFWKVYGCGYADCIL